MTQDDIFRKLVVANKFMSETECQVLQNAVATMREKGSSKSLMDLALEKKKITPNQAALLEKPIRYNHTRYEDQQCARHLIATGKITGEQFRRFQDEQSRLFQDKRQIISALELMQKKKLVTPAQIKEARNALREAPETETPKKETPGGEKAGPPEILEKGGFSVRYRVETMAEVMDNRKKTYISVLEIKGSVDSYTAPVLEEMCRAVFALAGDRGRYAVMDMSRCNYTSSAGIGIIISWRKEAQERGGDIKFVKMAREVKKVFALLGMEDLEIYPSVSEAFWAFMEMRQP
jgi:anti-anti-sigma factor